MGTVTVYSTVALTNVNYKPINDAAQFAYKRQTHNPSAVGTGTTLKLVRKHAKEFLHSSEGHLRCTSEHKRQRRPRAIPPGTEPLVRNDSTIKFSRDPDPQVFAAMANANHQSCIVYLDSILQGLYAYNHHQFDVDARPAYAAGKTETDYFVAYIDALGNVPN